MKKLYHKGTVHPSPPLISDQFSFLSAAILTLVEALSPEDREVLSYLISHSSSTFSGKENRCRNRPFPFVQLQLLLLLHGLLQIYKMMARGDVWEGGVKKDASWFGAREGGDGSGWVSEGKRWKGFSKGQN
ncbi:hypothetical protein JHK82_054143 [Glycine max]|nr:hypothetical protein JHK82_054143 [Glycine max]